MDVETGLSIGDWLAKQFGPAGTISFVGNCFQAWLLVKMLGWHRRERQEMHTQCTTTINTLQAEKKEIRNNHRKDGKEQWGIVNGFKSTMDELIPVLRQSLANRRAPPREPARPATGRKRG